MDVFSGCENEPSVRHSWLLAVMIIAPRWSFFSQREKNISIPRLLECLPSDHPLSPSLFPSLSAHWAGWNIFLTKWFFCTVGTLPWRLRLPRPPPFCVSVCIGERVVALTGVHVFSSDASLSGCAGRRRCTSQYVLSLPVHGQILIPFLFLSPSMLSCPYTPAQSTRTTNSISLN